MTSKLSLGCATALLMISWPVAAAEPQKPSDAQIAHIAYTAGQLDVEAGKLALTKSKNGAVRAFAETMVRDHAAVNEKALDLVKKLGVTPQPNATSEALSAQSAKTAMELQKLEGADFDRAYVGNEIAYHRTVNQALQGTLIPSAQNAELKTLLTSGLALFEEHQKHAETLAKSLP